MIHGGGSLHSLPCSHVGPSIQPAGHIPVELEGNSAARSWLTGKARRGQVYSARPEPGRRGRASRGTLPAGPPPPRRGGSSAPSRALAQAARARPPPCALAPPRPRALAPGAGSLRVPGGEAARAGFLRTFVAGAAPGPERAPPPPQPRRPGRRRQRRLRPPETFSTPPAPAGK